MLSIVPGKQFEFVALARKYDLEQRIEHGRSMLDRLVNPNTPGAEAQRRLLAMHQEMLAVVERHMMEVSRD